MGDLSQAEGYQILAKESTRGLQRAGEGMFFWTGLPQPATPLRLPLECDSTPLRPPLLAN